jgi:ElaB/YqjD/DUF883 family membrane-anchored ribosome-binding protein
MSTFFIVGRKPLFLAVALAAIATGLTVAWWLLPLGLLVYVAAVALASRDPLVIKAAQRSATRERLTSPTFRTIIGEIDQAQGEVERSIAQTSGPLLNLLQTITAQTQELVQQAHELAGKGQIIEQHLSQIDRRKLQDEISRIELLQIPRTSDKYTLQQLQETHAALVDRRANAEALETYIERIMAQLQNICANLNNVLSETVRLRTADAVSADSTSNQVADRLRDLNADMSAFQTMLDTALVQTGAAATP